MNWLVRHTRRRLLEVGCALGKLVELAVKNNFDAMGIDISKYAISEVKRFFLAWQAGLSSVLSMRLIGTLSPKHLMLL